MLGFRGRSLLTLSASAIVLSAVLTNAAQASLESLVDFNIPATSLSVALTTISRQGRVMISFPSEVTAGLKAGPLKGRLSVREALAQVLAGTGLRLAAMPDGSVSVVTANAETTGKPGDVAAIDVSANGAGARFQDEGFQAGDGGSTIRLPNTSAKELPQTVSVVTSQVLQSQGITTATDAVQNVAGVSILSSSSGIPTFTIRGFQSSGLYVNGMGNSGYSQVPIDDVERVEVLKGPTSILTGNTLEGGVVNVTTKGPTSQVIANATVRYGNYNYKTLAFDFGGPVPGTEGLTYRLNMSGNTADKNYAGYKDPHQYLISPSVKWEDKDTSILFGLRYVDERIVQNQVTFVPYSNVNESHPILKIARGVAEGNPHLGVSSSTLTLYSDASEKLGNLFGLDVTANNHFQYLQSSALANTYAWTTTANKSYPGTYKLREFYTPYNYDRISDRSDITLTYDAGFARQVSKFGMDTNALRADLASNSSSVYNVNPYVGTILQLFSTTNNSSTYYTTLKNRDTGFYYLEKFDTLNDRLHITGQVRFDSYSFEQIGGYYGQETAFGGTQGGLSWFVGAAFDVTPWFTAYGNRTNGFYPSNGLNSLTKAVLPPEVRDQSEFGGRFFLFDKKMSVTASYFDLAASNLSLSDGTYPNITYYLVPGLSSKGFELEAQGQILPGLNLITSFAAVRTKYQSTDYSFAMPGVPMYTGSLWATYSFQDPLLRGLTVGAGMHAFSRSVISDSVLGNGNTYKVPGTVTADAMIAYDFEKWSMQLKISNLFNKYYYQPVYYINPITIAQGRTFLLTAKYSFN